MIFPNLVSALHDGLLTQDDTWDGSRLHVSDLGITIPGEGCARSVWLRIRGAPRSEPGMGTLIMFDHGHRIHERVVEILRRGISNGWEIVGVEVPVTAPYDITGSADLVLVHREHGMLVIDFKTIRGRAFAYLKQPKPSNTIQVQTYVSALDADAGSLLYIDREGQNTPVQFDIERNDERITESCRIARELVDSPEPPRVLLPTYKLKANKGPDAVYREMPWPCNYCPYLDVSCVGALPVGQREKTLVGHYDVTAKAASVYTPRPGFEDDATFAYDQIREAGDDAGRDTDAAA